MLDKNMFDKKSIIIAHDSNTRHCAGFLQGLIGELSSEKLSVNAVVADAKRFSKYEAENKNALQKIIFLIDFHIANEIMNDSHKLQRELDRLSIDSGFFSEVNNAVNNINEWKLELFGIRYGWHGKRVVISIIRDLTESEFREMASYAERELKEYELNMREKVGKRGFNPIKHIRTFKEKSVAGGGFFAMMAGIPFVGKIFFGLGAVLLGKIAIGVTSAAVVGGIVAMAMRKDQLDPLQIKEQQLKFAVTHFCFKYLTEYLGLEEN